MNVAVFSTNRSFFGPVEEALKRNGHEVGFYEDSQGFASGFQMGTLLQWADVAFIEFCQTPMHEVLVNAVRKDLSVVARMHRLEMYNQLVTSDKVDWSKLDVLFVSAAHVCDRFMQRRGQLPKPKELVIAPTNTVDSQRFAFAERKWEPPYRICLVGNFVPKKRQYTTIQMFYDVVQEFGDEFKLDIVGARGMWTGYGNPEYFINCQDLIEDLGLKDKVSIFDKIAFQEMPDLYKREHIILSTSNEEGTHVSVAEAVASGCFAFVGNWRGSSDVYPEPETCWHFKSPGELMGLFRRFKECVSSGEAAERSRTCSEHVHKTLGGTDRYDRMVKVMEQALKARREGVEA